MDEVYYLSALPLANSKVQFRPQTYINGTSLTTNFECTELVLKLTHSVQFHSLFSTLKLRTKVLLFIQISLQNHYFEYIKWSCDLQERNEICIALCFF